MEDMTYHCRIERSKRMEHIINEIGLGTICKETFYRGCYICLTNTGITIIKDEKKEKIITMYVTTIKELITVYHGASKVPRAHRVKVERNQIKYIKNGKTIW